MNLRPAIKILSVSVLFSSCTHYYHTYEPYSRSEEVKIIDSLSRSGRYLILRSPAESYSMRDIVIDSSKKQITTNLQPVSDNHKLHISRGERRHLSYNNKESSTKDVTREVHVFIRNSPAVSNGSYMFADSSILKVQVLEEDRIKTRKSRNMSVVGGIVSGFLLVGLIIIFVQLSQLG